MGWSKRTWCCPYYTGDKKTHINCLCAKAITLRTAEGMRRYADLYCASVDGWRRCSLARAYTLELEQEEESAGE